MGGGRYGFALGLGIVLVLTCCWVQGGLASSSLLEVFAVPHTHLDPGWLNTFEGYYRKEVSQILKNVLDCLRQNKDRKFSWAETSFFERWYEEASADDRAFMQELVADGRWEFVGGGWVQHDEGLVDYTGVVEQMTEGHEYLRSKLGAHVTVGWQIDPFGHSAESASLHARAGMLALVINRVHHTIKQSMHSSKSLEFMWKPDGSQSRGILTHTLHTHYSSPRGFDFEEGSPAVGPHNVQSRAAELVRVLKERSRAYRTNKMMVPFGDDFKFIRALTQFSSLDVLFDYINKNSDSLGVTIKYATPSEYFEALRGDEDARFPEFLGDFMPYADNEDSYWTGFLTTHPFLKRHVRVTQNHIRTAEALFAGALVSGYDTLLKRQQLHALFRQLRRARRFLAVVQHHDGITGTSKKPVMTDYFAMLRDANELSAAVSNELLALVQLPKSALRSSKPDALPSLETPSLVRVEAVTVRRADSARILSFNNLGVHRFEPFWLMCDRSKDSGDPCVHVSDAKGNLLFTQELPVVQWDAMTNRIAPLSSQKTARVVTSSWSTVALGGSTFFACGHSTPDDACGMPEPEAAGTPSPKGRSLLAEEEEPVISFSSQVTVLCAQHGGANLRGAEPDTYPGEVRKNFVEATDGDLSIENEEYRVTFARNGGDTSSLIESVVHIPSGATFPVDQKFLQYKTSRSGAYIFRPDREAELAFPKTAGFTLVKSVGPLVQEMKMIHGRITVTVQLYRKSTTLPGKGAHGVTAAMDYDDEIRRSIHMRMEISPLPTDTELVTRFRFEGQGSGEVLWLMDGMATRRRKRSRMPKQNRAAAYSPAIMGLMYTAPKMHVTMVSNRPGGAATCGDDCFEYMLHRRLSRDDGRGMGEGNNDDRPASISFRLAVVPSMNEISQSLTPPEVEGLSVQWPYSHRESWWRLNFPSSTFLQYEDLRNPSAASRTMFSFLKRPMPTNALLFSFSVHDVTTRSVVLRFQNTGGAEMVTTLGHVFPSSHKMLSVSPRTLSLSFDLEDAVPSDRVFQTNGDHVVFSALNSEGNMIPPERQNTEEEGVFISASALRYASGKTSHRLRHLLQDGAPTGDSNFDQHSALKEVSQQLHNFPVRIGPSDIFSLVTRFELPPSSAMQQVLPESVGTQPIVPAAAVSPEVSSNSGSSGSSSISTNMTPPPQESTPGVQSPREVVDRRRTTGSRVGGSRRGVAAPAPTPQQPSHPIPVSAPNLSTSLALDAASSEMAKDRWILLALLGWSLLAIFFIYTRCLSSRSSGGNTSSHQQRRSPHPHSSFPSPTSLSLSTATAMGQHRSSHLVDRSAVGTPIDKSL